MEGWGGGHLQVCEKLPAHDTLHEHVEVGAVLVAGNHIDHEAAVALSLDLLLPLHMRLLHTSMTGLALCLMHNATACFRIHPGRDGWQKEGRGGHMRDSQSSQREWRGGLFMSWGGEGGPEQKEGR